MKSTNLTSMFAFAVDRTNKLLYVWRSIVLFVSICILIYAFTIIFKMKNTNTSEEENKVKFYHQVLWGATGTDGCLVLIGKSFFVTFVAYFIFRFVKKYML